MLGASQASRPADKYAAVVKTGQSCASTSPVLTLLSHGRAAASGAVNLPPVRVIARQCPIRKNPGLIETGVSVIKCLAMTYSHMGKPHTTIGDTAFHY